MLRQKSTPVGLYTLIALLAALLFWFGTALVRVENERYALAVGMCSYELTKPTAPCTDKVQTRTHWMWHIAAALFHW